MIMKQVRLNPLKENGTGSCMPDVAFSLKNSTQHFQTHNFQSLYDNGLYTPFFIRLFNFWKVLGRCGKVKSNGEERDRSEWV